MLFDEKHVEERHVLKQLKVKYKVKNNATKHHIHFCSYVWKSKLCVLSLSTRK